MPSSICWILDGHTPRPVAPHEWVVWYAAADQHVRLTELHNPTAGMVCISTVFLGLDHNRSDAGPPILFESIIFDGQRNEKRIRYATWDEAVAGHQALLDDLAGNGWHELDALVKRRRPPDGE
jgi:hypothetical protein